ncbi:MAG: flagellar motor switch protein FliG, partial [Jannaschia sp.]
MSDLSPVYMPSSRRSLTQGQKAAVIIRLLVNGGADPGISTLPKEQQRRIGAEMTSLRFVDRTTLAETVAEFAAELDGIGLHFPREVDRILTTLDGRLSLDVVEALIGEHGGEPGNLGNAAWEMVTTLDDQTLLGLMEGESDEVGAILLSKLPAGKAADLLTRLDAEQAEALAGAFARTEGVTPGAVSRIGTALGRQTAAIAPTAFTTDAERRVGDILNAAPSKLRRDLLDRLDKTSPDFANRVRAAIFSWENIPERLDARSVPKVLRAV